MGKKCIIVSALAALIAMTLAGGSVYVGSLPEYTLREMAEDVQQYGMEAIEPYLTERLQQPYHTVMEIVNSPLLKMIGFVDSGDSGMVAELPGKMDSVKLELKGVERGYNTADVEIGIEGYEFPGNIRLQMKRVDGKWQIDGISVPAIGWTL